MRTIKKYLIWVCIVLPTMIAVSSGNALLCFFGGIISYVAYNYVALKLKAD